MKNKEIFTFYVKCAVIKLYKTQKEVTLVMKQLTKTPQSKAKRLNKTATDIGLAITIFTSVVTALGAVLEVIQAVAALYGENNDIAE